MNGINAEKAHMQKVKIYADNREAHTPVVKILGKHCTLEMRNLVSADYRLSERVGVERKTTSDFLQSIIDHRLFSQLRELRRNFKKPLLLIEGDDNIFTLRNMNGNAINGAFACVAVDYAVPIAWTRSPLESAQLLLAIAKREQLQLRKGTGLREKPKLKSMNQQQLFFLSGIPGISEEKAKALLKKFGTPAAVFAASEKELTEADGIGKILAKRIRRVLDRAYEKSILEE